MKQIKVKCPHCGFVNRYNFSGFDKEESKQIKTCDLDAGGCDLDFVIHLSIKVEVGVQKLENEVNWTEY